MFAREANELLAAITGRYSAVTHRGSASLVQSRRVRGGGTRVLLSFPSAFFFSLPPFHLAVLKIAEQKPARWLVNNGPSIDILDVASATPEAARWKREKNKTFPNSRYAMTKQLCPDFPDLAAAVKAGFCLIHPASKSFLLLPSPASQTMLATLSVLWFWPVGGEQLAHVERTGGLRKTNRSAEASVKVKLRC